MLAIGLISIKKENNVVKDKELEQGKETNKSSTFNIQPILRWSEMLKAIDWNIIFLFGGGLVLGLGIESSGLASWIGN